MKTKVIVTILLFCFGVVEYLNAEPAYNLNGEWDAVITKTGSVSGTPVINEKDIIIISQQGDQFVGVRSLGGKFVGKNEEMIKGKLLYKMVDEVFINYMSDPMTYAMSWGGGRATITDDGNKIVVQSFIKPTGYYETVELTRK